MTSTPYEIPLDPKAQTFSINLGGTTYTLTFIFNPVINTWMLGIADAAGNSIVDGLTVVTGANLLEQLGYLKFPGQLVVWWVVDGQPAAPSFGNLGTDARLYFIPNG